MKGQQALVLTLLAGTGVMLFFAAPAANGFWWGLVLEIQSLQRSLHRELAATLEAVQAHGAAAAWWLVTLSFLYGVLHAAGPGHGKVVITTYLLTQRTRLRRGIALSVLASLCQGLTAVVAVWVAVFLLERSLRHAQSTADDLELLSYALVALTGLVLVVTRLRRFGPWSWLRGPGRVHARVHESHESNGVPAHGCCGHAHGPGRELLDEPLSWRPVAGMALAVGVRPCSGAILVLLVAQSLRLPWSGVASVLAMSLGTAMTVSVLAILSVHARAHAIRLASRSPGSRAWVPLTLDLLAIAGGLVILAVGIVLFQATGSAPAHPLR